MPKYKVDTDQGSFMVELDQPPSDLNQLRDLVGKHLATGAPNQSVLADEMSADVKRAEQTGGSLMQAKRDRLMTPQQIEQQASPQGFAQPAMQSPAGVMETLNKPFDLMGEAAGRFVQEQVDPVKNPVLSDVAGGLTKAAVQTLAPGVVARGAQAVAKGAAAILPGSQAAKMESAIDKTRGALAGKTETATKRAAGFQRAVDKIPAGERAPLANTQKVLDEIISSEGAHGIQDSGLQADAKRIKELISISGGTKDLRWIDAELTRIGQKTKAVQGVQANPAYKRLFAAMASDLESTSPVVTGQTTTSLPQFNKIGAKPIQTNIIEPYADTELVQIAPGLPLTPQPVRGTTTKIRQGTTPETSSTSFTPIGTTDRVVQGSGRGTVIRARDEAIRNQKGWEDLTDEFEKLVKTKRGMGGQEDINANQLLDKLKQKEFLRESLKPEDWKDVEVIFKKLADMPPLPPPRGATFGSGRTAGVGLGTTGALSLMGVDAGTAGAAGATVAGLDTLLRTLLPRPWGRKALRAVLESGPLNQAKIDSLNQIARLAENEMRQ